MADDDQHEHFRVMLPAVISFGVEALKAPALVAAGGIAAALGFYSANYSRLSARRF